MHTKASLIQELRALLPSNATVLMHSSCKSLGPMENGADTLLDAFASLSCFLAEREVPHRVLYWQPAAQALACREVVSPQDLPPLWQEILAAGGKAPLPPLEQEALPQGVSHAVYLCCRPQRAALLALQARWPAARRTVLWSGEWEGDPLPAGEARSLGPGRLTEDLSGLVL